VVLRDAQLSKRRTDVSYQANHTELNGDLMVSVYE
jgi:hypothetical protein